MTTQTPNPTFWRSTTGKFLAPAIFTCGFIAILTAFISYPVWSLVLAGSCAAAVYLLNTARRASHRRAARAAAGADAELASALSGPHTAYLNMLVSHLNRVELGGMLADDTPALKLTDIYIDLDVKRAADSDNHNLPVVGVDNKTDKRQPFLQILRRRRSGVIGILGESGAGKTTALRRSAIALTAIRFGKRRIPIVLDLQDHPAILADQNPPNLAAEASRASWLAGQIPARWFERQLQSGRCVVMLDGWDDIASESDRKKLTAWIRAQATRYSRSNLVMTSRSAGSASHRIPSDDVWQLRRLSGAQIASFAYSWCATVENRKPGHTQSWVRDEAAAEAGVFMSRLRANASLHELVANPLMLMMTALVHRRCGILPSTRAGIYADISQLLMERSSPLDEQVRHRVTQRLARRAMDNKTTYLYVDDVRAVLGDQADPDAVLTQATSAGWLKPVTGNGYMFSHTSLQHYFAACDLYSAGDDTDVATKVNDVWWRDTILLWAACTDPTRVVEACLRSRTIAALALAFDIAETAVDLDASVRLELKQFMATATQSLAENRLMGAVKASQEMRDMVRLYGGTRLTAHPVSAGLYKSYLESQYPTQERYSHSGETPVALGMWASDAAGFVDWLNGLPRHDDMMYWLPTAAELAEPSCDIDAIVGDRSVWLYDEPRPRLQLAPGVRDPYTVDHGWWLQTAAQDCRRLTLALYQVATVLGPMARSFARDLAGEIDLDRTKALELPRDLGKDTELAQARRFLKVTDLALAEDEIDDAQLHLDRVVEYVRELVAKALDFRRDPEQSPRANVPFMFLDRLSSEQHHEIAVAATTLWFASSPAKGRVPYGESLEKFRHFTTKAIFDADTNHSQTVAPDQLIGALERAHQLMKDNAFHAAPSLWLRMAAQSLSQAVERLTSSLNHSKSHTVDDIATARISLVAVVAGIREHTRTNNKDMLMMRPIIAALSTVVAGLTVLESRASGDIVENEVIVLVRK